MSEVQSSADDNHPSALVHSSEAVFGPPPAYDEICSFVAEYSGRLPRNAFTGTAPYEYSGCDYALILYAIMPSNCIDLSHLCWSIAPLPAQLEANLAVFTEAARGLQLFDAPTSSLHPHHLQSSPTCILHHIKVQHWLFVLSQRFQPEGSFDPVTMRMELRHAQLGEPRLTTSSLLCDDDVSITGGNRGDTFSFPSLHCQGIWKAAAVCEKTECDATATSETTTATKRKKNDSSGGSGSSSAAAGGSDAAARQKPWKSTTRPWRTAPTVKSPCTQTTRNAPAPQQTSTSGPGMESSSPMWHSLAEPWCDSERRRLQLKECLSRVRQTAQCTLFTNGTVDFDGLLSLLQEKQH